MIVNVTDTFRVHVDSYANHQPEVFRPGGEEITVGMFKGQTTQDKWVRVDRYFRTLSAAIHWGVKNGHLGVDTPVDELTVGDYVTWIETVEQRTRELISKANEMAVEDESSVSSSQDVESAA